MSTSNAEFRIENNDHAHLCLDCARKIVVKWDESDLHESAPHRAWRDTKKEFQYPTWVLAIAILISIPITFGIVYALLLVMRSST